MIDSTTLAILQGIFSRESRSLLIYIGDAYPWATVAEQDLAANLTRAVKEQQAAVSSLARFLLRQRVSPGPSLSYPSHFTSYNFVALDFLIGKLRHAEERGIIELKADLARISDPSARAEVEKLLAVKEKTLSFLRESAHGAVPVR